jgi:hypothetical protein
VVSSMQNDYSGGNESLTTQSHFPSSFSPNINPEFG